MPRRAGRLADRRRRRPGHLRQHELDAATRWSASAPSYLTVRNWQLRHGGFFTERDITSAAKVCVIGHTIVEKLFQTTNPLGETIRINNIPFRVIGVLETKGANIVGEDQDNIVMAPYTTVRKRLQGSNFDNVDVILASARSSRTMTDAEERDQATALRAAPHPPGDPADFDSAEHDRDRQASWASSPAR